MTVTALVGAVFWGGLAGVVMRRDARLQLLSLVFTLAAPVVGFALLSQTSAAPQAANTGSVVALITLVAAGGIVATGAGLLALLSRRLGGVDADTVEHTE